MDLNAPELYVNRELSWLEFNRRVVALAERDDVPALERLKFISIAASNLDEFFMVRVGGLERAARGGEAFKPGPDGLRLQDLLAEVWARASQQVALLSRVLVEHTLPALREHQVLFLERNELSDEQMEDLRDYYRREVHPCLTPIAIDPSHPFPALRNGSVNLALRIKAERKLARDRSLATPDGELLALVQVPSVLSRFVPLAAEIGQRFMALEDIISLFVGELFPGHQVLEASAFRLLRASDMDVVEEEAEDLLSTIRDELRRRDRGEPVRLDMNVGTSDTLVEMLRELIGVRPQQVLRNPSFVAKAALRQVYGAITHANLRDEPFNPQPADRLRFAPDIFRAISEGDILLHHPYDSFRHVIDFIEQAAVDPDVVAIKQTLYRTSGDSPIVRALARAAEKGKQVTALVEIKARFDEANNIAWAKALEEAGAHVVYGLIGLKTHAKLLLVTRREGDSLKRYLHVATGNYNPTTAKLYTDLGLFTAKDEFTQDAMMLFNVLTGYAELPNLRHLIVSPFNLRQHILGCIEREIKHAQEGRPSGITAKMNSLVDGPVIQALYRASQAGVKIDLMIRGTCSVRPGVPGVSENIRVRSILDRFLEHARIFYWKNGGKEEIYLSSADWMPRNLNRRIEVCFPVLDPLLCRHITQNIVATEWADNRHAWQMRPDGGYQPVEAGEAPVRAQQAFMEAAQKRQKTVRPAIRPEITESRISPAVIAAQAQRRRKRLDS